MAPDAPVTADGTTFEMIGTEFAFRPDAIAAAPGEEITISLRNEGAVLHNLEITELGVLIEAEPGLTDEATFTLPDSPGELVFFCNIPGHREAGMEGVLTLSG